MSALLPALAVLAAFAAALAVATPADAVVTEVAGLKVGLQPRSTDLGTEGADPSEFANDEGNATLANTSEYAIYWDPGKQFHHEWVTNIDQFFQALGEAGLGTPFANIAQYRDRNDTITKFHATFKGAYSDTDRFPSAGCTDANPLTKGFVTCLTDAQLRQQLETFISTHSLPRGMSTIYYLLTPPGVTVCLDASATRCSDFEISKKEAAEGKRESTSYKESFCSYHSDINPDNATEGDGSTILYAAIPWTAGTLGMSGQYAPHAESVAQLRAYETAYECQDGGFNPEGNKETPEEEPALTAEEKVKLEEEPAKEREKAEEERRLEGPHIQEPNQEGKGEYGDYAPGLTDVLINQIAEEEMNTVTDPMLNGWQDPSGNEATDMCRDVFANTGSEGVTGAVAANLNTQAGTLANVSLGGHHYYINNAFNLSSWSLEEKPCAGAVGLIPRFTAPDPVNAGEIVGVDGMESTVSLLMGEAFGPVGLPTTTYATFKWNFGDGTPEVEGFAPGAPTCESPWLSPCAASAFHAYRYGGTYKITLTITDVAGNTASEAHEVTVNGPPAPSSGGAGSGGSGGSGSGGSGGSSSGGSGGTSGQASVPAPVAYAMVLSRSLHSALHKGLAVSYAVNEQVAGHFEVLLSRTVAQRLGIAGSPATGLPAGTPPELVIAKAILVTTKGGRSAVRIQFPRRTANRLARARTVSLSLRLIVRNAATSNPATTTVLTSVTLSG